MDGIVSFAQNHTVIAILVGLGMLFFAFRKPKVFFSLLLLGLFLAGVYYAIAKMAGSQSEQKKRLMPQEETQSEKDR